METSIGRNCSFIIKVWVEEEDPTTGNVQWRGHITHVLSGNRRYFDNYPSAVQFAMPYLEALGIKFENSDYRCISST